MPSAIALPARAPKTPGTRPSWPQRAGSPRSTGSGARTPFPPRRIRSLVSGVRCQNLFMIFDEPQSFLLDKGHPGVSREHMRQKVSPPPPGGGWGEGAVQCALSPCACVKPRRNSARGGLFAPSVSSLPFSRLAGGAAVPPDPTFSKGNRSFPAAPSIRFLFIGSQFMLHASFPHSVALMQLRFASFAVIRLRRDFHPQECAQCWAHQKKRRLAAPFRHGLGLAVSTPGFRRRVTGHLSAWPSLEPSL